MSGAGGSYDLLQEERIDGDQRDVGEMQAYRDLWCAVVLEHVEVVLGVNNVVSGVERLRCRNWFRSQGFFEVCYLASMDPHFVRDRLNAKLADPV